MSSIRKGARMGLLSVNQLSMNGSLGFVLFITSAVIIASTLEDISPKVECGSNKPSIHPSNCTNV